MLPPDVVDVVSQFQRLSPLPLRLLYGGITEENVRPAHDAGATLIIAGSSIFGREDLPRAYRRLVQALA